MSHDHTAYKKLKCCIFKSNKKIDVEYMPSKSALKFGHWGQSNHNDAFTLRGVSPPLVGVGVTLSTPSGV